MGFTPLELFICALIPILVVIIGIAYLLKSTSLLSNKPRKGANNTTPVLRTRTFFSQQYEGKELCWKWENAGNDDLLIKTTGDDRLTMLEDGTIEIDDRFNRWLGLLFIHHHTSDANISLYVIHRDNPDQLQKIGVWPMHKAGLIKAFRKPSSMYYGGYYGQIPLILQQSDGMQLICCSPSGEVTLEPVTDPKLEHFLAEEIETAIEMILDTGDDDLIENVDEVECANAIDITLSVKHESRDSVPNIDVYRLRFKELKLEIECLHQACTHYAQDFRGRFFVAAKKGHVGLYRRFTNEAVVEGFSADHHWAEDTVQIDDIWHYAFIGIKDGVPTIVMDGISKSVQASQGAVEIRIVDGEAFYQLERSDEVYDLYRFSDQKLVASFYGESPYLERQELSPGSRFYDDENDPPETDSQTSKKIPYHRLAIRVD